MSENLGKPLYSPLYPPEGAPCKGYSCGHCDGVTRTQRGMRLHLSVCHGLNLQMNLFDIVDPQVEFDLPALKDIWV